MSAKRGVEPLAIELSALPEGVNLDEAQATIRQLQGMAVMLTGEQGESFRLVNEKLQEAYLWGLSDQIDRCARALGLDSGM